MELNELVVEDLKKKLNVTDKQIESVLEMLNDEKTVAFIARYRKEATGGLDEEQIRAIWDEYTYGINLAKRKDDVIRLIDEKGLLTDELKSSILAANKLIDVEDLYRPFKEKKKTKATEAIALGLEPLADLMMSLPVEGSKEELVSPYLNDDVKDIEFALTQAKYIVAEKISDNATYRGYIRDNALKYGLIEASKKKNDLDPEEKYKNYYEYSERISYVKPHRLLAINRAEDENVISVNVILDPEHDINYLKAHVTANKPSIFKDELDDAINDSYKRLIAPAISREIRAIKNDEASEQAIHIFSLNLKNLLMQPPMKGRTVLGVDPAFRTGCKLAVISPASNVLEIGVIYPNEKSKGAEVNPLLIEKSKKTLVDLITKYNVEIIAIGNGTASRETESFIAEVIKENNLKAKYVVVSEAGASVYSASELAIEEFPDLHVEQRSAISIARRIQDPLAELVKIDPKSIGVGQYQHDVAQNKLNKSLDDVVTDAVNNVGVNLNTASVSLLSYVSGLNKTISKNIIKYREENGRFNSRDELQKVSRLGPKAYEQCVGFTRILDGKNKLDMTPIHPESYDKALKLLKMLNSTPDDLGTEKLISEIDNLNLDKAKEELGLDDYTFNDIIEAFKAPLRDVRDTYDGLKLRSDIMHFEDIKIGDELDGVVRNVTDFGCFVDCGVKYDGLLHVSKMSYKKIEHPSDMLSVGDNIHVYVIGIDYDRHKLELSLIKDIEAMDEKQKEFKSTVNSRREVKRITDFKVGDELDGVVKQIEPYGAFIDLGFKPYGLLHISKMAIKRIKDPNELLHLEDKVHVYIIDIDYDAKKMSLSLVKDISKIEKEKTLADLNIGDEILGEVKKIADYGIFVDCGVKTNGLVHISKMSNFRLEHPSNMVSIGDKVTVYVIGIDLDSKKLALSMIK